jgi:hypothetical protein
MVDVDYLVFFLFWVCCYSSSFLFWIRAVLRIMNTDLEFQDLVSQRVSVSICWVRDLGCGTGPGSEFGQREYRISSGGEKAGSQLQQVSTYYGVYLIYPPGFLFHEVSRLGDVPDG